LFKPFVDLDINNIVKFSKLSEEANEMGKPRRKTSGRTGGKGKEDVLRRLNADVDGLALGGGDGKKKKKRERPPMSVKDCLDKAKAALDAYNVDDAFRHCTYALEMEHDNVIALETMGTILCEKGNLKLAKERFERAVMLEPEKGYPKYMSLAQLVEGEESVKYFTKGIELMEKKKDKIIKGDDEEEEEETEGAIALPSTSPMAKLEDLQSDISRGHISVAEIYLTDLCETEDAPTICKHHLDKAIETRPNSAEAHQLLASWCISMMDDDDEEAEDKFEEAKKAIKTGVGLWLPQYQKATAENADDDDDDESSRTTAAALFGGPSTSSAAAVADPVQPCPLSIEERINTAKILIELFMMKADEDQLANLAVEVLDTVLDEDDENIFVWYLLGWIGCMQGKEQYVNSKLSLEQALQIGSKKGFVQSGSTYGVDKEQIEAVLGELKTKMAEENVIEEEEEGEEEDLDEDYETEEEDD